ncbi:hypothetical protein ACED96_02565 [Clostridium thermobutyricum]|uniref:Uncharacterized protein n=1 Tax=Clostridium thermobutyricum DSM 4928 TaxID=1121339 RepID=A0A1V4SV02_9CLOT|nr:hypothetical protein [Clostridium thermobutyricum]OPX47694.1 hypothetical protein CLTHE_16740 [Clostridium thermobutyricum DSM 4928]
MKKKEIEEKYKLFLKIVVSVGSFDNYNSFFNIYSEYEDACRRILVLTPYKELEEVNEFDKNKKIDTPIEHEGNLWIKEYNILTNPEKINLDEIDIEEELIYNFVKKYNNY